MILDRVVAEIENLLNNYTQHGSETGPVPAAFAGTALQVMLDNSAANLENVDTVLKTYLDEGEMGRKIIPTQIRSNTEKWNAIGDNPCQAWLREQDNCSINTVNEMRLQKDNLNQTTALNPKLIQPVEVPRSEPVGYVTTVPPIILGQLYTTQG